MANNEKGKLFTARSVREQLILERLDRCRSRRTWTWGLWSAGGVCGYSEAVDRLAEFGRRMRKPLPRTAIDLNQCVCCGFNGSRGGQDNVVSFALAQQNVFAEEQVIGS
jgi:hypothetical protein